MLKNKRIQSLTNNKKLQPDFSEFIDDNNNNKKNDPEVIASAEVRVTVL